jgi:hypothetical protein
MAIDVTGKRLEAAEKLLEEGILVTLRQPIYTGDTKTGETELQVPALKERFTPLQINNDNVRGRDVRLTMAALPRNADGTWGDPIELARGDRLVVSGKEILVLDPGAVDPSDEPILYEVHAGYRTNLED